MRFHGVRPDLEAWEADFGKVEGRRWDCRCTPDILADRVVLTPRPSQFEYFGRHSLACCFWTMGVEMRGSGLGITVTAIVAVVVAACTSGPASPTATASGLPDVVHEQESLAAQANPATTSAPSFLPAEPATSARSGSATRQTPSRARSHHKIISTRIINVLGLLAKFHVHNDRAVVGRLWSIESYPPETGAGVAARSLGQTHAHDLWDGWAAGREGTR